MEEEEEIRRRLVASLDQRFSIASPNFKTTTFLFSTIVVWSKGWYTRIANTCKEAFRVFILCTTPMTSHTKLSKMVTSHDVPHHQACNEQSPSCEVIHCQWVKNNAACAVLNHTSSSASKTLFRWPKTRHQTRTFRMLPFSGGLNITWLKL